MADLIGSDFGLVEAHKLYACHNLLLAHKDALYIRSHYDAITITVADAPRADELLIALAFATGGRIHERAGGLRKEDARMDGVH